MSTKDKIYKIRAVCTSTLFWVFVFLAVSVQARGADTTISRLQQMAKDDLSTNPANSYKLATKAFDLSIAAEDMKSAALSGNIAASALYRSGKLEESLFMFRKGLKIAKDNNLEALVADMTLNLSLVYEQQGDYTTALQQCQTSLAIFGRLKDTLSIGNTNHNIGVVASHMGDYPLALSYFLTAARFFASIGNYSHVAGSYIAIGASYIQQEKYHDALTYLLRAQKINDSLPNGESAAIANMNIGLCYQELNLPDSALAFYLRSELVFNTLSTSDNKVFLYINMGTVYGEMPGSEYLAVKNYKRALDLAKEISYPLGMVIAYENLADFYQEQGDYKTANEFLHLQMAIKDTLLNKEKVAALEEMATIYKTRELKDKNKLLHKENDIQKLRLHTKDMYIYSGFGAALLSLVIGVLIVRQSRLKAARLKLELEQKQLQAQMNPHFIFNCLNSIQHFVVQNDRMNANRYLADFALLMRQTLDNSKDGTISLSRELKYLEIYLSFEHLRHEDKFSYQILCPSDINADTSELPSMIIQPFVENAIKHGLCNLEGGGGILTIRFYRKGDTLYCEVDDNGIGMKEAQKLRERSFLKYQSHGMELTRKRLALISDMHGGAYTLKIEDRVSAGTGTGTLVTIKFPQRI